MSAPLHCGAKTKEKKMKIMVVGGGGREHAIVKKLLEGGNDEIFVVPSNGGINKVAKGTDIKTTDLDAIVDFAEKTKIDYAVVACDDPLVLGLVDLLNDIGVPCFGPARQGAMLEGSKIFAKNFMDKYGIPTAKYKVFTDAEDALKYLKDALYPTVIKADGLAAGKGVTRVDNYEEAQSAVFAIMRERVFGKSGDNIVIEEFLQGEEFTLMCFTDGKTIIPMVSSSDHKKIYDGEKGPNTGGMGTIAPSPVYSGSVKKDALENIVYPTLLALQKENIVFKGCLYFGLMATDKGVKVIEYNCRFGDPEAQVVLPLLKTDLLTIMKATTQGTLDKLNIEFSQESACCVVMASRGYPAKYEKGFEIFIPQEQEKNVCYAGVIEIDGKLFTSGGRVLGAVAVEDTLSKAIDSAYKIVEKITFANAYYRKDIGKKYC